MRADVWKRSHWFFRYDSRTAREVVEGNFSQTGSPCAEFIIRIINVNDKVYNGQVAAGTTFGESDRTGAYTLSDAVTPGDLAATLVWRFGLNPQIEIQDRFGRPLPLVIGGPIRELFPAHAAVSETNN